ncbi:MAG: HAD hydrolase-like protein [Lachnospiraceae bacterium]|nr:HAD hydrolase-like protein [Lachnospiraceae bacterium]MBR1523017.1 HAD hydrolase-like protein [Lachnospiraceae bacterium]
MTKNKKKIKAVIFDLDDTLVSEYEFIVSGYKYMSEYLADRLKHTPQEIEERLWDLSKETYSHAFNRLFDSYGEAYTEEELQKLILLYRSHPADLRFYPDVYPVLKGLRERDILTGIISDGDPGRQKNKIRTAVAQLPERYTVSHWFDEVILNDEFGGASYRKPNPHGFRVMAERLGVTADEMIYIGDNPAKDFHIAADLPVRTARIVRENGIYNNKGYLNGIKEKWNIDSLTDILQIVEDQNKNKTD